MNNVTEGKNMTKCGQDKYEEEMKN
jgi:hypothetical protein